MGGLLFCAPGQPAVGTAPAMARAGWVQARFKRWIVVVLSFCCRGCVARLLARSLTCLFCFVLLI